MKIGEKTPIQRLSVGKVEDNQRVKVDRQENPKKLPEEGIRSAAAKNEDAAATITRVSRDDSSRASEEVEAEVRAASQTKVEDVDNLANLVASRIRQRPEEAINAQGNAERNKVFELLQ